MYLKDSNRYLVFASKGGADTNPDWYHNLKAHPHIKIEVGDQVIAVHAEEVTGPERDRFYALQSSLYPRFADYQKKTKRIIPVIALTPESAGRLGRQSSNTFRGLRNTSLLWLLSPA